MAIDVIAPPCRERSPPPNRSRFLPPTSAVLKHSLIESKQLIICLFLALHAGFRSGRWQLCPGTSDVNLLRDLNGVVNLDTEVTDRALDLGVTEQQLNSAQVPCPAVD